MKQRFVAIWFRYLKTDWFTRRHPELVEKPFVLFNKVNGRMMVSAANKIAEQKGIFKGTILADARAIEPLLEIKEDNPELFKKVLERFAEWFIRYSPIVAVDSDDGIIINCSGCTHLWGGEENYLKEISLRLANEGYTIHAAMAATIGTAWAVTRFGTHASIIESGNEINALATLPGEALRISDEAVERLHKLGLYTISDFINMPRPALKRRFGIEFIRQLNYALGYENEIISPVEKPLPYQERLNCLEPIVTVKGIEIALEKLIEAICKRLKGEEKGLRHAIFKAYRIDGKIEKLEVHVGKPSNNEQHIFKLFALKINTIEPALGIELFTLDAIQVEDNPAVQEQIFNNAGNDLGNTGIAELIDRIAGKIGEQKIQRFLPDEHYWPERSVKKANSLEDKPALNWSDTITRPLKILLEPESIMVTAPIPDYPPMLFKHKGKLHKIIKADGPERIEQEWWLQKGLHRDYYHVEDEEGNRYWLFRSGHYNNEQRDQWYLHGYCA